MVCVWRQEVGGGGKREREIMAPVILSFDPSLEEKTFWYQKDKFQVEDDFFLKTAIQSVTT